jgi:hypothetical protein
VPSIGSIPIRLTRSSLSCCSRTAGSCSRVRGSDPGELGNVHAVAFDSTLVYGPNSTSAFRADPPPPTAPPNSFNMRQKRVRAGRTTPCRRGVIPCLERHRDTTNRRTSGAAPRATPFRVKREKREWLELNALLAAAHLLRGRSRSWIGPPGQYVSPRRQLIGTRHHRLLRCGTTRTYAGSGVSSGEDMASVAVIADSRLMSRSRARRTATSGSSDRTAGALTFLDRFSICFHSLSDSRSVASACVEAPSAAIHHDQAVFARLVSVSDIARAGASSPSTTARSVTLFLSERGE